MKVLEAVNVGVNVNVLEAVNVGVNVNVFDGVNVGVKVFDGVYVFVGVRVLVGVKVSRGVPVKVGVNVLVGAGALKVSSQTSAGPPSRLSTIYNVVPLNAAGYVISSRSTLGKSNCTANVLGTPPLEMIVLSGTENGIVPPSPISDGGIESSPPHTISPFSVMLPTIISPPPYGPIVSGHTK